MAFQKRTYIDGQTVITAENLNAIQDEIIRQDGELGNKAPSGYGYGEALRYVEGNESGLEQIFSEILATMPNRSTKQVCFTCSNGTLYGKGAFHATICKDDSEYAHVYASTYNRNYKVMKSFFGGKWNPFEWENPPMIPNEEYRTTKRHNGRPVYAKAVDLPPLGYNAVDDQPNGISNVELIWVTGGFAKVGGSYQSIPYYGGAEDNLILVSAYGSKVHRVHKGSVYNIESMRVNLECTKSTD